MHGSQVGTERAYLNDEGYGCSLGDDQPTRIGADQRIAWQKKEVSLRPSNPTQIQPTLPGTTIEEGFNSSRKPSCMVKFKLESYKHQRLDSVHKVSS